MRRQAVLSGVLAVFAAALLAGCGGASTPAPAASTDLGAGAAIAPADAAAFVAIDSDLGSAQWNALDSLLERAGLLSRFRQSLQGQTGVSWSDLRQVLGPELDAVVLPGGGASPQVVLLARPTDVQRFVALLRKAESGTVSAQVGGWTAVAAGKAALAAVTGAQRHLADDSLYQEATAKLPGGGLAQVYANGAEASRLAPSLGAKTSGPSGLVWAAADVAAAGGGLRVDGLVRGDGAEPAPQPYTARLVGQIPSGALLVADFQATRGDGAATSPNPFLSALGDVAKSLGGETALYVTPESPLPAVTLVTRAADPQATLAALNAALGSAGSAAGPLDLGSLLGGIRLSHTLVGPDLVVSTSQAALRAFADDGPKLPADGAFQDARSAAAMPDQTTGFVYVNLKDALPSVQGLLGAGGGAGAKLDLDGLGSLLAYGSGSSGDLSRFTAFLRIG